MIIPITIWIALFLLILLFAAYFRWPLLLWTVLVGIALGLFHVFSGASVTVVTTLWCIYGVVAVPLNLRDLRRYIISDPIYRSLKGVMPTISQTEQEALDAGDVWWEGELFSGNPNFKMIRDLPKPELNEEEQAFVDGPTEELCKLIDDWQITHEDYDLSPAAWNYIKDNKFFAMIIPKKYGGLGYSALCHSAVVAKLASRGISAAVTVMVPNSLGPGKLLMTYGTKEQKDFYLPRLASTEDIPCFGLTGPEAGSDAGAMPDYGIVCKGSFNGGDDVLGIRLNFDKRYITLAPVATLLGIAFKLQDPDHLLGGETDVGITLALVRRNTEGVEVGLRHFPANQSFMNGPIRGKNVFIPLDWVIGGRDYVGKGWSMLMECLVDGRAISLPAMSASAGKVSARYSGAYSRIRSQFHTPIGYFEGIEEPLAVIGGQTYAMDASRLMILSALDQGLIPSVISGVVKQQLTERMRMVVNHSMDIHGGHGISMGPRNFLGRSYQGLPISITVEGANILTRSLIVFGQGVMRSHPYLLKEVEAFHNEDKKQGSKDFDKALFAHVGFVISNVVRTFWISLMSTSFTFAPGSKHTRYYYRQLIRMSSAFALLSDVCLGILGGELKRREKISGRLADALSNMYILSAVLKHFEDEGELKEDIPLMKWACEDALVNIQDALKGVMKNLPVPFIGRIMNFIIFPWTQPYHGPNDRLGHKVARLLLTPSDTLNRLSKGIYITSDPEDPTGRLEHAIDCVTKASDLERKLRLSQKNGLVSGSGMALYADARDKNIINDNDLVILKQAHAAINNAIKVDEFSVSEHGWKVETP